MKPELIAPAGNWAMLTAAINAGADAVYFGVKQLNMRITAQNFELSELKKVVDYCHKNKVKAYLTLNTIIYDNEIEKLRKVLKEARKAGIDAIIAWDFAVIEEARKLKLPTHLSTQASVANSLSASFFKKLGIKRIVLARELNLEQIKHIKQENPDLEIECFIHGAMCVSISGRCFLSQEIFRKSANRGECLQPCRREYIIKDPEEGHELILGKSYVLSPKDLCTITFIDKLKKAGITGFKIEGRNRSVEYVKTVTECYRKALDKKLTKSQINQLIKKLKTVYNKKFSTGFYLGLPTADDFTDIYGSAANQTKHYIGVIKNFYKKIKVAEIKIETGSLKLGDKIMIQGNKTGCFEQKIKSMEINHKKVSKAKKGQRVGIKLNKEARPNDKLFLIKQLYTQV